MNIHTLCVVGFFIGYEHAEIRVLGQRTGGTTDARKKQQKPDRP
jgi:hypothetical protein